MNASTVRDAMTASPTTIDAHATAVDAARVMAAEDVGSLPVTEGEDLVGIVTDRADGKWAAGCHFLRELTENELKELVWHSSAGR